MSLEDTRKCPAATPASVQPGHPARYSNNKMADSAQLENELEGKQNDLALIKQKFSAVQGEAAGRGA